MTTDLWAIFFLPFRMVAAAMPVKELTGLIITRNEEKHIASCIRSLQQVCSRIVVLDSGSTDQTREIAASLGAEVHVRDFDGFGRQKCHGSELCATEWILNLDADERVSPEMAAAIAGADLSPHQGPAAFGFRRRNLFCGRQIRHCGWSPDICYRLYSRSRARWSDSSVHERLETRETAVLPGDIVHYAYESLETFLAKQNRYSTLAAGEMLRHRRQISRCSAAFHGAHMFFVSRYLFRLGFLDGTDGLSICLIQAVYSYLKYAKYYELLRGSEEIWDRYQ